jgi:serpin B
MDAQHRLVTRRQAVLAGLAALGGIGTVPAPAGARALHVLATAEGDHAAAHRLAAATRGFGFRLFDHLAARQPAQNTFISPLSVSVALAMAYNGARGRTRQAMAVALGVEDMSLEDVNRGTSALLALLAEGDPHVHLTIADSLWARLGIAFNPRFMATLRAFYGATASTLDFGDPLASRTINAWVRDQTRGKIDRIVPDRIDPATVLFLINAVYFKGAWSVPFDHALTKPHAFTLPGGASKRVPMMTQSGRYSYYADRTVEAVSLPYGGGRMRMYVFLPRASSSLAQLRARLNPAAWEGWLARFAQAQGAISLPRFTASYGVGLKGALTALGMGLAFDRQRADFGDMVTGQRAYIQDAQHKAVVAVEERGTTAAGATSVQVGITAVMAPQFTLVVDRPFLCAIADSATGTVLFVGAITDPTAL